MSLYVKFIFVACCFLFALGSYKFRVLRCDWAWLVAGLGFTVGADFFLVLHNQHLQGVAVFCFAHVCYINRVKKAWFLFPIVLIFVAVSLVIGSVLTLAAIYAALFAYSLLVNFKRFRQSDDKVNLPKFNRALILTGLVLFALCDINVLLFNLPVYFDLPNGLRNVFLLIWIFYIPSQALLAVSACKFSRLWYTDFKG